VSERVLASVTYREPPRSYASALALVALLGAGFVIDLLLGGGVAHLWGWLLALVLVVGVDWLVVYAARSTRTIVLDDDSLTVGEESIPRSALAAVEADVPPEAHVLGMTLTDALPRGVPGLALRLSDGSVVTVPTRRPSRLAGVLGLSASTQSVRPAEPDELPLLAEIDERADAVFRVAGYDLPDVTAPERPMLAVFVIGTPPVGFAQIGEADGNAHLEEVAVLPGHLRQGLGTQLVEAACGWATEHGYPAITLSTYADVPWNAPFYERLGFSVIDEFGPDVSERREWEAGVGLDAVGPRVVMRRTLR
jgi:GNAT superfamily N-acetyltransferase